MATGAQGAYFHYFSGSPSPNQYTTDGPWVEDEAVCCNILPGLTSATGSGYATAFCPSGTIAVGGGGYCNTPGAALTDSEPVVKSSGAGGKGGGGPQIPGGWHVICSTGTVTAWANCISPTAINQPDLSSCQIVETASATSPTAVTCPAGQIAVAAGTYCSGGYATFAWIQSTNNQTYNECSNSGSLLFGSAICCNGTVSP